jgi:hypothetical protein
MPHDEIFMTYMIFFYAPYDDCVEQLLFMQENTAYKRNSVS